MATKKISELPVTGVLTGVDEVPVVQAGVTKRVAVAAMPVSTAQAAADALKQSLSGKGQPGGYAGLSATVGDTGKAIDAYTGSPLSVVVGDGSLTTAKYADGSVTAPKLAANVRVFTGPTTPAFPAGEYVWLKTNGAGVLLDIVSGVI